MDTLQQLIDEGKSGTFDFAFIDADKVNYCNYYELCLTLIRRGGVITVDNVFMFGAALQPDYAPALLRRGAQGIFDLNERIRTDARVHISMLNISDGITIAIKI